jgi:hypothetical protein
MVEKGNEMNYLASLPTDALELDLAVARSDYQFYTHIFPDEGAARRAAYLASELEAELERRTQDPWTTDADRRYFEGAN